MTLRILNSLVITAILSFFGYQLLQNVRALENRPKNEEAIAERNSSLQFQGPAGIDVSGRVLPPEVSKVSVPTVVFVLRGTSTIEDLAYWRDAESAAAHDLPMKLVGYCDGKPCAIKFKQASLSSPFPVVAFGELVSSQALIQADRQGNAILVLPGKSENVIIPWRDSKLTPRQIVREVLKHT